MKIFSYRRALASSLIYGAISPFFEMYFYSLEKPNFYKAPLFSFGMFLLWSSIYLVYKARLEKRKMKHP